jgi:hypothetical protein
MLTIHNIDKCIGLQLYGDKWIEDVVQYYEQYVFVIQTGSGTPFSSIGIGLSRMGRVSPNGKVGYDIEVDGKPTHNSFRLSLIEDMNMCVAQLGKLLYNHQM